MQNTQNKKSRVQMTELAKKVRPSKEWQKTELARLNKPENLASEAMKNFLELTRR